MKFGRLFAAKIKRKRKKKSSKWRWHSDEVFVKINGELFYMWRAVDHEGEVLEVYVSRKRDKAAAKKFLVKAMKIHGSPDEIVTDKLASYGAAMKEIGNIKKQNTGHRLNNRCENSHLPFRRRERAMQKFRRKRTLMIFTSVQASVYNHFNHERHLISRQNYKERRSQSLNEWRELLAA